MNVLTLWIWFCAYLNCVGWILSCLHQLNAGGYAVALTVGLALAVVWRRKTGVPLRPENRWTKLRRRFRRGFPLAFLTIAGLAFLGGALYAPSNYDALAYRVPRVLHWLDAGQWHWIHSVFVRLNVRCCGMEWVSTPMIALFHSTRPLFLINFVSFLLLPGLVFSVFRRLGVRPRVAWHWMWLAPTGYCFALQAGSIGNDMFGALFVLAAVDFALRAGTGGGFPALGTSIIAAGMMTAAKMNNLPLLLPWAVALLPSLKLILRRPLATLAVAILALGASGLPTIYFNLKMSGDWSGGRLSDAGVEHAVIYRTGANVGALSLQNLVPPLFPMAQRCNQLMKNHLPADWVRKLALLGETPVCWFQLPQMQTEETAGLGMGVTVLLGVGLLAALTVGRRNTSAPFRLSWPAAVRWSSALALLALLTQANVSAIGRLSAGFYLLPCAVVLAFPGQAALIRRRWWQGLAWLAFLLTAVLLVVSPARPLFPRDALLNKIRPAAPAHPLLVRIDDVYSTYRDRPTAFAPALAELPPETKILGYIAFDKPETSLWQPFGIRRIVHVCPGDRAEDLKAEGVRYILLDADGFEPWFQCPLTQWLQAINGVVVKEIPLRVLAAKGTQTWCLVQLR